MKRILIILNIILAIVNGVRADSLSSSAIHFGHEDTAVLTLHLQNELENWNSYQFVLTLPEGIEWKKDLNGKFLYQLSLRHDASYSLTVHQQSTTRYAVVCYSSYGTPLTGKSGELVSLSIEANDSLRGKKLTAEVSDILFSTRGGQETELDDISIEINVTAPLTVTANSYTREYGDPNPTFGYSTIGPEIKGVPMIYCDANSTSPVGKYDIVINKGSVTNYNDKYVNGTLTVTKAPLTITVSSATKRQGDPMPEFIITYSGFKNGETEDVLTTLPTVNCMATAESPSGTYPLTLSGATAQNYEIIYVNDSVLTVTEAPMVTVTANSYTREYGDENPVFGFTSEGAPLTGTPEITCEATPTSDVGTYRIIIGKGSVTNFNDRYVNGTLTVTKAPLTITVNAVSKQQGDPIPEFTLTYEGFKNGETKEVLTKLPTITCEATADSPNGTYPIKVSGAEAQNYEITYVDGTLTIYDGIVFTANSYSREYGDENPTFEYTWEGAEPIGTPSINCAATKSSPVGTYDIIISRGSITNDGDEYINGTLTITPAPLTAKAKDVSRYEGEANPALEIEYKGWKLNEDESVLTEKPMAQTSANEKSRPGEYEIKVTGGAAKNYTLQLVSGTLTVLEIPSHLIQYDSMSFDIPDAQIHEVTLTRADEKAHVVVPSSVMYREKEWTVTAIADSVFAGHTVLTTVEIPSTVTRVGKDVFDQCPHLAAIVWRSPQKMTKAMMGNFSNPNLLLYLTTKTTMLDGVTNLVDLSTMRAEHIVLTDDGGTNDFYCPMAFTADEITYSHVYQQQTHAGSSQGWEALSLPFDVTTVTHEEKGLIHPFATLTDTDIIGGERPFWLYEYSSVGFKEADKIVANTPYIISMPNEATLWEGFILKGQVTFQATNASIHATADAAEVSGGERSFRPNFNNNDGAGLYMLNVSEEWNGHAEGSVFVQSLRAAHPFEACFTSASGVKAFSIVDGMTDGIREMNLPETWRPANSDAAVYDLSGRKMTVGKGKEGTLRRGMYIVDGKKYIKR